MPQIPLIRQQTSASMIGLGPGPQGRGRGLEAVGDALQQMEQVDIEGQLLERRKQEQDAAVAATDEIMGARSYWLEEMRKRQESAQPGAEGFTPQLLKDYEKDTAERVKRAGTEKARTYLRQRLGEIGLSLREDAIQFEAQQGLKLRETKIGDSLDKARTAVEFRPDDFEAILADQLTGIAASGSDAQRAAVLGSTAKESLAQAAVLGLIRRNPAATLKQLNDEKSKVPSINALTFEDRGRLRNAAEAEVRRMEAEARARQAEARDRVDTGFQDAIAAKAYGLPATMPSQAMYTAAYGKDGDKLYARDSQLFSVYDVVGAAVGMPPQEAAAQLQRFAPKDQAGAAMQSKVFESAARLYGEQRKAFEADPVGTLMRRDPQLQQMFAAAVDSGDEGGQGAVEAYVSRARSLQQAAGLPGAALLPESVAASVAAQLEPDPKNPGARAANVALLEKQWGKHYQDVLRQVQPKLTGYASVLTNMPPDAAIRLDQAIAQKAELEKAIPAQAKGDISREVESGLTDFALSMADNADAETQIGQHMEAAELLAKSYAARGMPANKAGRLAVQNVLSAYQFKAQGADRPMLRIPAQVDADAVAQGALGLRERVAGEGGLRITSNAMSDQGAAEADLAAVIRRRGYWVTNEDGTGLVLRIPHRSGKGYVYRKDGTRVEYPWDAVAVERAPIDMAPWLFRGPME